MKQMKQMTKRERINGNKNALEHVSVRCAKMWVEKAMNAAERGDYLDMMTYIRLAKWFEEEVIIMEDE
jgi:hypothetical protein